MEIKWLTPQSAKRNGSRHDGEEDVQDGGNAHHVQAVRDVAPVLGISSFDLLDDASKWNVGPFNGEKDLLEALVVGGTNSLQF